MPAWIAVLFVKLAELIAPILLKNLIEYFSNKAQEAAEKKERDQKLAEAVKKYKDAKTPEDEENAFKDIIRKSNP